MTDNEKAIVANRRLLRTLQDLEMQSNITRGYIPLKTEAAYMSMIGRMKRLRECMAEVEAAWAEGEF